MAGDKLVRDVARAKIAKALFQTDRTVKLGRYHLLEQVGAGGMGVVWGAWDPELERRVAIKVVREAKQTTRDRILAEGQALAKLSHPNVVPVFDVGVVDDQVYIVMEWVRGDNLRAWCREPRRVREIVAVYREAGQGLAAAHAAGLIHRDFKPDNAIRGDDGRVRVLDFGLARGEVDGGGEGELTHGAGTPRYMAPEQVAGAALTPAADQYAFCVSLREALGDAPASWLAAIIERGSAQAPSARFASMDELVRALGRDPATIWRRRAIAVAGLAAIGGAFAIGSSRAAEVEQCVGGAAEIAGSWNVATRAKLVAHLDVLGPYARGEATALEAALDDYTHSWASTRDHACRAHEGGELTPQLYERDVGCLSRARAALDTVVDLLATAPRERFANAVVAAHSLPDAERCAGDAAATKVAPPARELAVPVAALANEIERARMLAVGGDPRAVDAAAATVATADRLGYAPVVARANLAHGLALTKARELDRAVAPLARAVDVAIDSDDDFAFVEAYARLVYAAAVSDSDKLDPSVTKPLPLLPYAERVAKRLGPVGAVDRARLANDVAVAHMASNDRDGARVWFSRALAEAKTADGQVELIGILGGVALVEDDPAKRAALLAEQREQYRRRLGPNHPNTLDAELVAAQATSNPVAAAAALRELCPRYRALHPTRRIMIDTCLYDLGWLADERGDSAEARASFATVELPPHAGRVAHGYVDVADGKRDAIAAVTRTGDDLAKSPDWWTRAAGADAYLVAALGSLRAGRPGDAVTALSHGLPLVETAEAMAANARRLARYRLLLARLLAPSRRARELASLAAAWYRTAGGYDAALVELDAITAAADSH